ncbi:MAG: MarR family transcriptional regulator [Erythrobacter sp.]
MNEISSPLTSNREKISHHADARKQQMPGKGEHATDLHSGSELTLLADQLIGVGEQLKALSGTPSLAEQRPEIGETCKLHPRFQAIDGANDTRTRRQIYAELALAQYERRRNRNSIFGRPDLFGEPAWDILLDLYVAFVRDKPVSVSSACIGSAAPPTTGLRWLGVLCEEGFTLREHDPNDLRRVLVRLTERGIAAMDAYFAAIVEQE